MNSMCTFVQTSTVLAHQTLGQKGMGECSKSIEMCMSFNCRIFLWYMWLCLNMSGKPNLMLDHQFSPVSHEVCPTPSRPSTDLDRQHPPNTGTTCIASVRPEVFEVGDKIPHYFDDLAIQTDINILNPLFQVDFKLPHLITRGYGPFLKAQSPNESELVSGCGENHGIWPPTGPP